MLSRHVLYTRNLISGALLLSTAGCLSLGGKTTYVQETPETAFRLSALESRVKVLEQALSGSSTPADLAPTPP